MSILDRYLPSFHKKHNVVDIGMSISKGNLYVREQRQFRTDSHKLQVQNQGTCKVQQNELLPRRNQSSSYPVEVSDRR